MLNKYTRAIPDQYAEFRKHYNRTKERNKKKKKEDLLVSDILTLKDIKDQWIKQRGRCAYTGIPMCHASSQKQPHQGSLDRIDSSKGYVRGNIQFVALSINLAKIDFSDKVFKKFIKDIRNCNENTRRTSKRKRRVSKFIN